MGTLAQEIFLQLAKKEERNIKSKKIKLIMSIIFGIIGYGMLFYFSGWQIALAMFIVHFSMNLERSAD